MIKILSIHKKTIGMYKNIEGYNLRKNQINIVACKRIFVLLFENENSAKFEADKIKDFFELNKEICLIQNVNEIIC